MDNKTYNGWRNYATWRVNLEYVDGRFNNDDIGLAKGIFDLADYIKEEVEIFVQDNEVNEYIKGWAMAFLNDVDWREIAQSVADNYPNIIK